MIPSATRRTPHTAPLRSAGPWLAIMLGACGGGGGGTGTPAPPPPPTPPLIVQLHGAACALGSQDVLFAASGGFSLSPVDPDLLVYARPDGTGTFQIHRRRLASGADTCLTCGNIAGGPAAQLHKGAPAFLADGSAFVLQVESSSNPFPGTLGTPGAGWYNNVWIATSDGVTWRQLTNLAMTASDPAGVLQPHVSPDGSRITFAELVDDDPIGQWQYGQGQIALNTNPFGIWRLTTGAVTGNSVAATIGPSVSQRPAPPSATTGQYFEVSGWSPDSRKVLFTSDVGKDHVHKLDLWSYDIVTGALLNLSGSDDFDEFGSFSPDGRRIVYMSSAGTGWEATSPSSIPFRDSLATELYLMNADGSAKVRVSDLNGAGMPPSLSAVGARRAIVAKMLWAPDGRSVYFELAFFGAAAGGPGPLLGSILARQTFAGACGDQP